MEQAKYSIKLVSKLTGLSAYVIRAWERRYNTIIPMRTDSNRRYYSETDVKKLKLLSQATQAGFNIGSIASLSVERLHYVLEDKKHITGENNLPMNNYPNDADALLTEYLDKSIDSITKLRQIDFENLLLKASIEFDCNKLINNLIIPLINKIGERWYNGSLRIAQEHMASSVLIAFLHNLRSVYNNFQDKAVIISGTPQGHLHEFGALLVSVIAASEGYKVIYLGTNIPLEEIVIAATDLNASAVCLSLVYPENDIGTKQYLADLRKMLNKDTKVVVGGRAALSYRDVIEREGFLLAENIVYFKRILNQLVFIS
jgi:methanogenic corrinoid protein MtbC1